MFNNVGIKGNSKWLCVDDVIRGGVEMLNCLNVEYCFVDIMVN